MGDVTGISWCDHTYNAWIGCTKVSEGCKLCYAERDNERFRWTDRWGPQGTRRKTKTAPDVIKWNKQAWLECGACGVRGPLLTFPNCPACGKPALRPTRQRVFVNSLSDIFEDRSELWPIRNEFWALSQMCSNLDFLLLTKRPENIIRMAPRGWKAWRWPDNIWLGVSVENQARAEERIPLLLHVPANVRWISVEPMLEAIDLSDWLCPISYFEIDGEAEPDIDPSEIDWVVLGGESGPNCRPMQVKWAREVRNECQLSGTPFFMKQLGGRPNRREKLEDLPADLRIREWPQ